MKKIMSFCLVLVLAFSMIASCANAADVAEYKSSNMAAMDFDSFDWCSTSYNRAVAAIISFMEFTNNCKNADSYGILFPSRCHIFNFWSDITVLYECDDGSGFTITYNPTTKMFKAENWSLSYAGIRKSYDIALEQYEISTTELMQAIKILSGN